MLPSEIPSSSQAIDNNRYSQIHLVPCCLAAKAKTDPTQKVRTIHPDPGSLANVRTLGAKSPNNPGGFWWCFLRATPPLRLP